MDDCDGNCIQGRRCTCGEMGCKYSDPATDKWLLGAAVVCGLLLLTFYPLLAHSKTFDERKAEALAEHRIFRRAVERVLQSCLDEGFPYEKCLIRSRKFAEEKLASLPANRHNTRTLLTKQESQ